MYNVQDYSVLYNNAGNSVICEGLFKCGKHLHDHILPLKERIHDEAFPSKSLQILPVSITN